MIKIKRVLLGIFFTTFACFAGQLFGYDLNNAKENPRSVGASDSVRYEKVAIAFDPWQIDFAAFRDGMNFLQASSPDYLKAISCFDEIIRKTPNAKDIDYPIGWAIFCEVKAGKLKEALVRYRFFRENYYGWRDGGASGAVRLWDNKLDEIKEIIKNSSGEKKMEIWQEMKKLDQECEKKFGKAKPYFEK